MKVSFISLGCAKNLVNTEQMMALCREAGIELQEQPEGADAVVINTCGFIDSAKAEAIDTILSMAQLKEDGRLGKILVTGCLTQRYQQEILDELPEVDGMMGTGSYGDIVPALRELMAGQRPRRFADINGPVEEFDRVLTTPGHYAYLASPRAATTAALSASSPTSAASTAAAAWRISSLRRASWQTPG